MNQKKLFLVDGASDNLLSNLDSRDIALWLIDLPKECPQLETLISFLGLPWRLVLSEVSDKRLISALDQGSRSGDDMARRRGFVQIVDSDPSRITFPQRCLPIYLLNGREGSSTSEFENRLRRMTMVEDLRRSGVRQVLVVAGNDYPIPQELSDLWESGFRTQLTITSELENAETVLNQWLERSTGFASASLSRESPDRFIESVLHRYVERFAEQRKTIRVRDQFGRIQRFDITEIDEPERPILEQFLVIEDRDLTPLFDNDKAGQQAVRAATALDTSIVEFRDVFRLHPHMPTSGNLDPKTLQKAFERENLAYKGLNWELEDLLPNHFFDLLVQDHPSAVIRADKVADKVHWELTRDGKALLRKMIRQFGTHADLSATIAVLKAFHFYCSIAKRQ